MSGEYLGDFLGNESVVVVFDTFNSAGASITMTGFDVSDIEIYKANSVTQRSSDAGIALIDTDGTDLDGVTGIHGFTVDLSDDTDSGFYATGQDYYIVVSTVTINAETVSFIAARFSIQNRNIISVTGGSAALSTEADSYTLTTGTQSSGTIADTTTINSGSHQHTDDTGTLDLYYEFDVGGNGTAVSTMITAYLNGSNDAVSIQAYNWGGSSWDTIGVINGVNNSNFVEYDLNLLTRNTGTGANSGKVRIRFNGTGLTSSTLFLDQILLNYAVITESVGYSSGRIWINTDAVNTNTESFVDGVADNPVSTIAAANTLSGQLGINAFNVSAGSSITLSQNQQNDVFYGEGWDLSLAGYDVSNSHFYEAIVSGIGLTASGNPDWHKCNIGTATLGPSDFFLCGLSDTLTMNATGDYRFVDCYSEVAGGGTPVLDFAAIGANTVIFRRYSGGVELQNMASGDAVSIEGDGQVVINANCSAGELVVRGNFKVTDNSSGAVSLEQVNPTANQVSRGRAQSGTANTITLEATESSVDGQYDPASVLIVSGAGAGQARNIIDYNGTTKVAVIDKDWRVNPDSTSSYTIIATAPQLHVNEGLAQAGGSSTVTLNTSASSTDDVYIGQTVFLVGGLGQDQARIVTDYDGTTKVATVHKAWETQPDSTTSYVMIPSPAAGDYTVNATPSLIAEATRTEIDSNSTQIAAIKAVSDVLPDSGALTSLAQEASISVIDANIDSILIDTETAIPAQLAVSDAKLDSILADTGTVIPAQISALNNVSVNDIIYTALTESYANEGAAPTLAQALYLIQQKLGDFSITGTTLTVKRLDGSTTAATYTLNDATNPTGITRT